MAGVYNWQLGRTMTYPYNEARPQKQAAAVFDTNKCIGCGVCTVRCKFDAIHLRKVYDVDSVEFFDRHEAFAKYDEERKHNIQIKKAAAAK